MVVIHFVNDSGEPVERGDVVVVGGKQTPLYQEFDRSIVIPEVDLSHEAYDTRVCGVVCALQAHVKTEGLEGASAEVEPPKSPKAKANRKQDKTLTVGLQGFTPQELEDVDRTKVGAGQVGQMVILGAFAACKVDADIAPVQVGDLLTTSPTKGHAQKLLDPGKAVGAVLGKALGTLKKGKGTIPVLVAIQ